MVDAAYFIAMQTNLFAIIPVNGPRPAFFAVASLVVFGTVAVGAVAAEVLVRMLRDVSLTIGPFEFGYGIANDGFERYYLNVGLVF